MKTRLLALMLLGSLGSVTWSQDVSTKAPIAPNAPADRPSHRHVNNDLVNERRPELRMLERLQKPRANEATKLLVDLVNEI